jgi:hypothetical protein
LELEKSEISVGDEENMVWPKGKKNPEQSERMSKLWKGENNPAKRPDVRKKISKSKTGVKWGGNNLIKRRKKASERLSKRNKENNPAKRPEVRAIQSKFMSENNPSKRPEVQEKQRMAKLGKRNPDQSKRMSNGGGAYAASFCKNPSKPQVQLFKMVKLLYPSAILNYVYKRYCIDIAIPELQIAIEYDGEYWHKGREEADSKRQKAIEKDGWKFIRYRKLPNNNELIKVLRRYKDDK